MTAVVADSSPLHYLVIIGQHDVLPRLFDAVIIPPKVAEELSQPTTSPEVRAWIQACPDWLRVDARPLGVRIPTLDPGEADAIALALELRVDLLLIDERSGRAEALRLGLRPLGVVGILEHAAERGFIDLRGSLRQLLSETNFRISQRVVDEVLARERTRPRRNPNPGADR